MLNWFAKRLRYVQEVKRDERGFTLIELLVVIIIIGILAAIAIPVFLSQRTNAENRAAQANVRSAGTAEQVAFTETGSFVAVGDLGPYGFNAGSVTPEVTGGGSGETYCVQSEGGDETWRMTQALGAPEIGTCGP